MLKQLLDYLTNTAHQGGAHQGAGAGAAEDASAAADADECASAASSSSSAAAAAAATYHEALTPSIIGFKKLSVDENIKQAARHVYEEYLSKPFSNEAFNKDRFLRLFRQENGTLSFHHEGPDTEKTVYLHRHNHGLAYTLRGVYLIPVVAHQYANAVKFSENDRDLLQSPDTIQKLQLTYMFTVAGRENEIGFHNDEALYQQFVQASAEAFEKYATDTLNHIFTTHAEIQAHKSLILNYGDPSHHDIKSVIFRQCHRLDLARCFKSKDYYPTFILAEPSHIEDGDLHTLEYDLGLATALALVDFTIDALTATGDRIRLYEDDGRTINYKLDTFYRLSTDVQACLQELDELKIPRALLELVTAASTQKRNRVSQDSKAEIAPAELIAKSDASAELDAPELQVEVDHKERPAPGKKPRI